MIANSLQTSLHMIHIHFVGPDFITFALFFIWAIVGTEPFRFIAEDQTDQQIRFPIGNPLSCSVYFWELTFDN